MDTIIRFIELGLIRELTSEEMYGNFNFQILKVLKLNSEFSVLLDLHPLNDVLNEFQFKIPNLNNIKRLSEFRFYCLIDIAKAYCQLAYMSGSEEELFCFSIKSRHFCFVGLPYEVKSTPSYYALAFQDIFKDIL
jgi:hypothetical protein